MLWHEKRGVTCMGGLDLLETHAFTNRQEQIHFVFLPQSYLDDGVLIYRMWRSQCERYTSLILG